jgi:hypothetical protein
MGDSVTLPLARCLNFLPKLFFRQGTRQNILIISSLPILARKLRLYLEAKITFVA